MHKHTFSQWQCMMCIHARRYVAVYRLCIRLVSCQLYGDIGYCTSTVQPLYKMAFDLQHRPSGTRCRKQFSSATLSGFIYRLKTFYSLRLSLIQLHTSTSEVKTVWHYINSILIIIIIIIIYKKALAKLSTSKQSKQERLKVLLTLIERIRSINTNLHKELL